MDEGILPLLLHLIDLYLDAPAASSSSPLPNGAFPPEVLIVNKCTETLANLSINRKNRREIASCGIASRLAGLFEKASHPTCSSLLLLMGNLLSSNLFHDKVATAGTIGNMLDNLFDIHHVKQFNAVAYCLCQLSKNMGSCEMLVQCSALPIVLGYLRNCPKDAIDYLWTVLHTITQYSQFFTEVMHYGELLITELYEEIRYELSSSHQLLSVVKIALNLTQVL